ncbi:MAG: molybdopterin-dependent oxidoreductase [Candidatus Bathyarchaeota archaeon]|nr:molybdopterin-dependent oxidoreductase [Candidatus Bathyarchaeota archaeon]
MKKANKIAIIALAVIVAVTVPVYLVMRQNAGIEGSIQIKGAVGNAGNFTYNQLEAFAPVTVQVELSSSSRPADNGVFNYRGVPLKVLLEEAQVSADATSVYVQASDGYGTTIPIQDAQNSGTILAYQKDGAPLTALSEGGEGPIRLIIGADEFAQRWVRGVSVIEVR